MSYFKFLLSLFLIYALLFFTIKLSDKKVEADGSYSPSLMYVSTSNVSGSTAAAVSLLAEGVGSKNIPANYMKISKVYRIRIGGVFSTGVMPTNLTVKLLIGGTTIAQSTIQASLFAINSTNLSFNLDSIICIRGIGTTGTVVSSGGATFTVLATGAAIARADLNSGSVPITINTTMPNAVDLTAAWSANQSGQSVTGFIATIEELN